MEELLKAILVELQSQRQPLGFCHSPRPRYIYANRQYNDCLWYFWDGAKKEHTPIEYPALSGVIEKIEMDEKEFRGKPDQKLNLFIRADRLYVIQSGFDTLFAKGLLSGLAKLSAVELKQVITIEVEAGDTEQVLFCRVYAGAESVFAPYEEPVNWEEKLCSIQSNLGQATATPPPPTTASSPKPAPRQPEPEPVLSPLTIGAGQQTAIDEFNAAIKSAGCLEDCKNAWNRLQQRKGEWGSLPGAEDGLLKTYRKAAERFASMEALTIAIGEEVKLRGWSRKEASNSLQERYNKATRAELTIAEAADFLRYLRSLPAATPA